MTSFLAGLADRGSAPLEDDLARPGLVEVDRPVVAWHCTPDSTFAKTLRPMRLGGHVC